MELGISKGISCRTNVPKARESGQRGVTCEGGGARDLRPAARAVHECDHGASVFLQHVLLEIRRSKERHLDLDNNLS